MHKLILMTACIAISFTAISQAKYNDAIKINLSGLVVKNISVQYERKISKRLSVALNYRNLPYGTVPFSSNLAKLIGPNSSVDFSKMNVGSNAITPELRLYVGKKGALRGFYLAPFASFANYKTDFPIAYASKTGVFTGSMKSTTGGLQLGTQMRLSKRFYLDWWIIGPNFGNSDGNLTLSQSLNAYEQQALSDKIAQLQKDVPLNFIKSYTVDGNGAILNLNGPWAGLRGLGFNLSFQF